MRILLIGTVSSSVFGFRRKLMEELVRRGHEVAIYIGQRDDVVVDRAKQELGVDVRYFPLARSGINPFADLRTLWFLYREFRKQDPDCVFAYFAKPVIWGGIAAWLAGVPRRVGMLEGLGYAFTKQPGGEAAGKQRLLKAVQVALYRLALPRLTRMIFLNPDDPVDLLQANHIRLRSVNVLGGIGVDLDALPYSSPPVGHLSSGTGPSLTFVFVGRLLAEKGINEYVGAARLVKAKFPSTRFVVLGGLDADNPGAISKAGLDALVGEGLVEYPGHVDGVAGWLSASDVFVLPSYREGVPASTQEAMAIGRAVLTTDVPGCRETVVDGLNGFMVPPWSPEALAERMLWMIEHPDQMAKMGCESRRIAEEKFDVVDVNRRLCELLGA